MNCPKCGKKSQRRGSKNHLQYYQCTNKICANNYFSEEIPDFTTGGSVKTEGNNMRIIFTSMEPPTQDELITRYKVNLDDWELISFEIKDHKGYRKDRKVTWDVVDGVVINGEVRDSGKMLIVGMYNTNVVFRKKVNEINARNKIQEMIDDAKAGMPAVSKINYPKHKDPTMFELSVPDIHFGRLSWNEESGEDYDIKIAYEVVNKAIDKLLSYTRIFEVDKILFPIGQDWYNVNSKDNMTVNGTIQSEDTRGKKTYKKGRQLAMELINKCASIAPTDVIIIPGNHDDEKIFYMGDALEIAYENNPNVTVNNDAVSRKYYLYGKVLLGFTHGCDIKTSKVPMLMPIEAKEMWAKADFREWHMGHVHHKQDMRLEADEDSGILIRKLRSIAADDAWTFNKGFKSLRAAEAFVWHPDNGLIGQFTTIP